MDTYIIFDLEASCWEYPNPLVEREIIEIGAYKLNAFYEIIDEFDHLIKPTKFRTISSYCTSLTGITNEQLSKSKNFIVVYQDFINWINKDGGGISLLSWGREDKKMLEEDCAYHNLQIPENHQFYDLKEMYQYIRGITKPVGISRALKNENLEFEGIMHRALDDSYNLTRLFLKLRGEWFN